MGCHDSQRNAQRHGRPPGPPWKRRRQPARADAEGRVRRRDQERRVGPSNSAGVVAARGLPCSACLSSRQAEGCAARRAGAARALPARVEGPARSPTNAAAAAEASRKRAAYLKIEHVARATQACASGSEVHCGGRPRFGIAARLGRVVVRQRKTVDWLPHAGSITSLMRKCSCSTRAGHTLTQRALARSALEARARSSWRSEPDRRSCRSRALTGVPRRIGGRNALANTSGIEWRLRVRTAAPAVSASHRIEHRGDRELLTARDQLRRSPPTVNADRGAGPRSPTKAARVLSCMRPRNLTSALRARPRSSMPSSSTRPLRRLPRERRRAPRQVRVHTADHAARTSSIAACASRRSCSTPAWRSTGLPPWPSAASPRASCTSRATDDARRDLRALAERLSADRVFASTCSRKRPM